MTPALSDAAPTDDQVAELFNVSRSPARTLLRNTISKRRFQFDSVVTASAKAVLKAAAAIDGGHALTIRPSTSGEESSPLRAPLRGAKPRTLVGTRTGEAWRLGEGRVARGPSAGDRRSARA
jgi:hypothetical protein